MNPTERTAHTYAESGWRVFPAIPDSKVPATEHGFHDATTDHGQIARWWRTLPGANVAIATGSPGPDVLDIDVHQDGSGFPAWNRLKAAGLVPEPKALVKTPSGGLHAYFAGTGQRNGHLPGQHIDFRGAGGYVVSPPSEVGSRPYVVIRHQPSAAVFDWSAAREHLAPAAQATRKPSAVNAQTALPGDGRNVRHLVPWLEAQHEGNRNAGLFWAASRAVEADDTETLGQLARAAEALGLDTREVERTVRSALRPKVPQHEKAIEHQGPEQAGPLESLPEQEKEAEAG